MSIKITRKIFLNDQKRGNKPMIHDMKLNDRPFNMIKNGKKRRGNATL